MDYNKQDIEFAFTILNHREMLDDKEVTECFLCTTIYGSG